MVCMLAWILRYLLFAYGNNEALVWMLYTGIILHGICYDFFFVTGQIFVDKRAPKHLKASAQGMITFATYGLGMFIGTWFSRLIVGLFTFTEARQASHTWTQIWLIPMAIAIVVLIFFAVLFRNAKKAREE